MTIITLENDISVYCLTASSFPAGVKEVYDQLHLLYPPGNGRTYFGISYPDGKGGLVYKAAVKLNETDKAPTGSFEPFTIRKGRYLSEDIRNFMADVSSIGNTFRKMIEEPGIATDGYCLEMYLNPTDVRCMVLLSGPEQA
jgi:predicted transcriptional regulator YdeE